MRNTLLFIKVCLLLAAFVGSCSSHAAKFGEHNFVGDSSSSFDLALGSATTEDDHEVAFDGEYVVAFSKPSTVTSDYDSVVAQHLASIYIARAPPVNPSF